MAIMIPPQVSGITESSAERFIFGRLRDELPSEWFVLHSLGLTGHNRKPWAEIDFVLVGPLGIFCVEVKGGSIARRDRVWTTTTRKGRVSELKESPFAQVGSASAALHKHLRGTLPSINFITGYGVMFPDVRFSAQGPDIESELVYDAEDAEAPADQYVARIADFWIARCRRDWGREPQSLTADQVRTICNGLARDFDLCLSLRSELGSVNEQLVRLTEEQCAVVAGLAENPRVLTVGGAGTGKTLIAVAEARRLAQGGKRVLLACFNRQLALHLRDSFPAGGSIQVHHLHGLMAQIVRQRGLSARLPDAAPTDLFEIFYPEVCLEAVLDSGEPAFDALILDEAQDMLLEPYLDLLDAMLTGGLKNGVWRAFLDPNQNLFDGTAVASMNRLNQLAPTRFRLNLNCRNTAPIATTTSVLSGMQLDAVLKVEGPPVDQRWFTDPEEQRRQVSETVRALLHKGIRPQEIVIISPRRFENSGICEGLIRCPAPVIALDQYASPECRAIRFASIAAFKGLEADAVLLIDVENLSDPRALVQLYVGASRARVILSVFIQESQRDAYGLRAYRFGEAVACSADTRTTRV